MKISKCNAFHIFDFICHMKTSFFHTALVWFYQIGAAFFILLQN